MIDFHFHKRLRFKITLTLVFVLLSASVALVYLSLDVTRTGYHKLVAEQFRHTMNIVENYIDFMGQNSMIIARHTASETQFIQVLEGGQKVDLDGLLQEHAQSISADHILLLDRNGRVVADSHGRQDLGRSLASWRLVRSGLDKGEPGSSIVQASNWFILYASAVVTKTDHEGHPLGLVLIGHALNDRFIGNIRKNTGVDITVVRDRAIMVSTMEDMKGLDPNLMIPYPEYQSLLNNRDSIREYRIGNDLYFIGARRLESMEQGMNGSLLLAYPRDRLDATEQQITTQLTLLLGFGFLLVLILGLRLSNTLVQRLRYLGEMSRRIASGELDQEIAIRSHDEFSWLAENFNRMRNAIRDKNKALKTYSQNLEQLVDSRTQELSDANVELMKSQSGLYEAQRIAKLGSWEIDLGNDHITYSDEFARLFELSPREAISREELLTHIDAEDREKVTEQWRTSLSDPGSYDLDYKLMLQNKSVRYVHENARLILNDEDEPVRISGTVQDITEHVLLEEQIRHQATYDELTGLPNRFLFKDRLEQAYSRCHRKSEPLALLFIDLDGFKPVNDRYGHKVGDLVLEQVGLRLRESIRVSDTAARYGGDEFTVILPDQGNLDNINWVINKIMKKLVAPYVVNGLEVQIGASIGVAMYPDDADTTGELIRKADEAMYRVKSNSRIKTTSDTGGS